jgi:hypothetical protein
VLSEMEDKLIAYYEIYKLEKENSRQLEKRIQ